KLVEKAGMLCNSALKKNWISKTSLLSDEADLVQMGWAYCDDHLKNEQVTIVPSMGKMSNPCFALNKSMAQLIIDQFDKVDTTIDIFIHRQVAQKANCHTFYPPLFYEMSWSTGEVDSTIHPKQIRIDYLSSKQNSDDVIEGAKEKLAKHQKHTNVYPILVLGHPRCGSGYTAAFLDALGLKVGHEEMLKDGISSWMFTVEDDSPWALNEEARTRKFKYFKHVIHHVRDPRAAIPSIMRDNLYARKSYDFRRKHILSTFNVDLDEMGSNFDKAVASYIYWNKLIMQQNPTLCFRVEDQASNLEEYISSTGEFSIKTNPDYPQNNVNADKRYNGEHREKPSVNEEDFLCLPSELLTELNVLCNQYGYEGFPPLNTFDKTKFINQLDKLTLQPTGWLRSAEELAPVTPDGEPLPWWTIPGTEFVKGILSRQWRVFEYGCGNSTLWWSKHVSQVIAVDHDEQWVEKIKPNIKTPHAVLYSGLGSSASECAIQQAQPYLNRKRREEFGYDDDKMTRRGLNDVDFIDYADAINRVGGKFDCIIIDGMARRLCAEFAVSRLNDHGIIIFDNSNRSDYLEGYQILVEQGFYQIRFSGPVVGAPFPSCTSVFIKSLDALPKVVFEPSLFDIFEY
ncbi:TPA: hypothetical protein N2883_004582, partial [Vibrio parahaemolyticus]|nr:hypothetical protein [Vibrio parahaemolyticus]